MSALFSYSELERKIITTHDGSTSILLEAWDETYHSRHGAIQEAQHVFIQNGLSLFEGKSVAVLEIGFGTGLNALISFKESQHLSCDISYCGIEAYPVTPEMALQMNYPQLLGDENDELATVFKRMHHSDWETKQVFTEQFNLTKRKMLFEAISFEESFDLVYFDAFGYRVQPELWSEAIFKAMYKALRKDGVLVTYACRTVIKNAMKSAGFCVEKLPGAPGKREMLRAKKC